MAPRRAHKKSRFGCDQCKRRRVKCDERGPPCTNCVVRELPCRYPVTPPIFNHSPNPASASSTRSTDSTSPSTVTTSSRPSLPVTAASPSNYGSNDLSPAPPQISAASRLRELELMHKFTSETYKSICGLPTDHFAWQVVLPRKALSHDFLMDGILALASLHIATGLDDPAMAKSYIDGALEYHSRTFLPFRKELNNINPTNCEAVFAFSIITTILGITLPRLTSEKTGTNNMMEHILAIFELLQGTRKIFLAGRAWLEAGCFSLKTKFWENASGNVDDDTRSAIRRLRALNHERLATNDVERYQHNVHLLARLEYCFSGFSETRDISTAMAWLAILDKDFIQEFRHGEPLCVLMFMHWGVLLHELENHTWWPMGSGKALVTELLGVLQSQPGLEEFTLWPRQQIGPPTE